MIQGTDLQALHRDAIVLDAHTDALLDVIAGKRRLGERSSAGQFDFPRAIEGGLTVELMAMFVDPLAPGNYSRQLFQFIDAFYREAADCSDAATIALRANDVLRAKAEGKVAMILSLEGAEGLEGSLGALRVCHRLGLRFLGITWNRRNEAADGVGEAQSGSRLTSFGVELVEECNRLGIVLDMAHLSPSCVDHVLEISEAPVVVTHGNCAALWPHRRNLTDRQLEAIASKGGVVGATCVPAFSGDDELHGSLDALLDHIDHMVRVMGDDHVGFGMDFDGMEDSRMAGMEDIAQLPNLTSGLAERGHSPETIRKILGQNFLRVFRQVAG
ncbi:MAG TPA: dipeptidase [Chloroflexota bacterium]|nr:dipeptidase [Chloroflexota bacterium]